MLVFKLPNKRLLFTKISHWPVVPCVKLVLMCPEVSSSVRRHQSHVLVYDYAGEPDIYNQFRTSSEKLLLTTPHLMRTP